MPSHPPEDKFYEADDTFTLWKDVSRLYEDFCGSDFREYPKKQEKFKRVLRDVINRLEGKNE
jgi:hypothetical protein